MSIDGVTVFGVGLIVGGLGLLATAAVGLTRWFSGRNSRGGRRPAPRRPGRPPDRSRPSRPVGGRLADDRAAGRPPSGPPPGARPRPDPRPTRPDPPTPRLDPRPTTRTDPRQGNSGRTATRAGDRRPVDGPPPRRPVPPPVQPSALLAETVLLHPVPAWSAPAQPRNDPPWTGPTPPDLTHNQPRRENEGDAR